MIYFSELKGKKIYTDNGSYIGVLDDLTFVVNGTPKITKIVIKDSRRKFIFISIDYLSPKTNGLQQETIFISDKHQTSVIGENEMFVARNILDKQIIDLVGHKVVRVNDVTLQDKGELYITGVDIGFLGILRWLGLANLLSKAVHTPFNIHVVPKLLSWADIQPLELSQGKVVLKKEEKKLKKVRPEDLADYLEITNITNTHKIIKMLDDEQAIKVISNLNSNTQKALFQITKIERASKWISLLQPDDAVDILLLVSRRKREDIISTLSDVKRLELMHLIELSKISSIGRALTTKYLAVSSNDTVSEIINKIKKDTQDFPVLNYIYVTNENKQLVGVFNLHELLLQKDDVLVYKFMMQNVISVHLKTPQHIAVKKMLKYRIDALPVIDKSKRIIGTIVIDDLSQNILEKYE